MADDELDKKRKEKEKAAKFVKAINPRKPKNPEGTTFFENQNPKYKGKHREEDK